MELIEGINARKSIRGFQDKQVPREVLEEVLRVASRSPSATNYQPWEVSIVGGQKMEELKSTLKEAMSSGAPTGRACSTRSRNTWSMEWCLVLRPSSTRRWQLAYRREPIIPMCPGTSTMDTAQENSPRRHSARPFPR